MTGIPVLETERLILRPFELSDAADVQRYAGDYEVAKMTTNIPHPYEDGMAEEWIGTHEKQFVEKSELTLAITHKQEKYLIGAIGLVRIKKEHQHAEMGYWIGKPFWGKGYCTEAARAMLDYSFNSLNLNRVHANHMVHNPASGKVMRKIGMKYEGRLRKHFNKWGEYVDIDIYGILREEFPGLD
ncbi:GNAT family N-acetyltransferase [candidate division KSB1 bacterium]|nr:GNAT family N-acetyltransferase [candidate division KSB1 bacterium]